MEYNVIVSVNSINDTSSTVDKYNKLFATAYQAITKAIDEELLPANSLKVTHEDNMFHSLDEYYAHLETLYTLDPVYVMLPLDETPFTIDANKRSITNPKITVLQSDQHSEMVTFVIDRYFDFKDLDTVEHIYAQWTLPDGTEGATRITFKDTIFPGNGKLRLGWILDNEVTSQKGVVKFSVRFFDTDTVTDKNGDTKTIVVYSFNTLTSTLNISESLQPHINEGAAVNDPMGEGLFRKAIINSQIRGENMPIPIGPRFDEPGLNLNQYESLTTDGTNTLTMCAQAYSTDTGALDYEWWYKPAEDNEELGFNSNTWYPYNAGYVLASEYVEGASYFTKNISGEYVSATVTKETFSAEKHYVNLPGFKEYGGSVNLRQGKKVVLNDKGETEAGQKYYKDEACTQAATLSDFVPGATLYERFTTYTVPEGSIAVTGQYKVVATNTIAPNKSRPVSSAICYLVSPANITFKIDLNSREIFDVDKDGNDLEKKLSVTPNEDTTLNAERTFTWNRFKTEPVYDEDGILTSVPDETTGPLPSASGEGNAIVYGREYKTTEPGWYQVIVSSTLNRETKSAESTMCKLTSLPATPSKVIDGATQVLTMTYGSNANAQAKDNGVPVYMTSLGAEVILDLDMNLATPEGLDDKLFSEGYSYTWMVQEGKDKSSRPLSDKDVGEGKIIVDGFNTRALKVRCVEDGVQYIYRCLVTNTLNGKTASCKPEQALSYIVQ